MCSCLIVDFSCVKVLVLIVEELFLCFVLKIEVVCFVMFLMLVEWCDGIVNVVRIFVRVVCSLFL